MTMSSIQMQGSTISPRFGTKRKKSEQERFNEQQTKRFLREGRGLVKAALQKQAEYAASPMGVAYALAHAGDRMLNQTIRPLESAKAAILRSLESPDLSSEQRAALAQSLADVSGTLAESRSSLNQTLNPFTHDLLR